MKYQTRHVAVTATGETVFANNLSGTAESIIALSGHICGARVSIGKSITDVAGAGVNVSIRLLGDGLAGGKADFTAGGLTSDTTSTSGAKVNPAIEIPLDIDVTQGSTISASVFENGVDPGTAEITLTLCYN